MKEHSLVRTIYLYIFTMLGLTLLTIGGVRFVNMGFKALVFKKADLAEELSYQKPPSVYLVPQIQRLQEDQKLSTTEKKQIQQWLVDYQSWKKQQEEVNPLTSRRQRDASLNLALILVGLPLYLYHWHVIKQDVRSKDK